MEPPPLSIPPPIPSFASFSLFIYFANVPGSPPFLPRTQNSSFFSGRISWDFEISHWSRFTYTLLLLLFRDHSFQTPVRKLEANPDYLLFSPRYGTHSHRSHGFCIGHITPEAQVGGPIALVRDGDVIHVDAVKNIIELRVPEPELEKRRREWKPHPLKVNQGTLYKYVKVVSDASRGCITDA